MLSLVDYPRRQVSHVDAHIIEARSSSNILKCECDLKKYVCGITVWHHKACQVMTNGDPEGQIFLSEPQQLMDYFS